MERQCRMFKDNINLKDIDKDFLNFRIPTKLPTEVKEILEEDLVRRKELYSKIIGGLYRENPPMEQVKINQVYYFSKFIKVFSKNHEDIWILLHKKDPSATRGLAIYLSDIYHFILIIGSSLTLAPVALRKNIHMQGVIQDTLENLKKFRGHTVGDMGWHHLDESVQNQDVPYFLNNELQVTLEKYLDRLKFAEDNLKADNTVIQLKKYLPTSRKRSVNNAEAIFFIKMLNINFKRLFGEPHHEYVANFIEAVFGTMYTYKDIENMTRKRK